MHTTVREHTPQRAPHMPPPVPAELIHPPQARSSAAEVVREIVDMAEEMLVPTDLPHLPATASNSDHNSNNSRSNSSVTVSSTTHAVATSRTFAHTAHFARLPRCLGSERLEHHHPPTLAQRLHLPHIDPSVYAMHAADGTHADLHVSQLGYHPSLMDIAESEGETSHLSPAVYTRGHDHLLHK